MAEFAVRKYDEEKTNQPAQQNPEVGTGNWNWELWELGGVWCACGGLDTV
jgi:hypothetical protein